MSWCTLKTFALRKGSHKVTTAHLFDIISPSELVIAK